MNIKILALVYTLFSMPSCNSDKININTAKESESINNKEYSTLSDEEKLMIEASIQKKLKELTPQGAIDINTLANRILTEKFFSVNETKLWLIYNIKDTQIDYQTYINFDGTYDDHSAIYDSAFTY